MFGERKGEYNEFGTLCSESISGYRRDQGQVSELRRDVM